MVRVNRKQPKLQPQTNHTMHITLQPAYGRDYRSVAAVKADYDAGKDFIIASVSHPDFGRYCSKRDLQGQTVNIRYAKNMKVMVLK
jgi:hypothetical protein